VSVRFASLRALHCTHTREDVDGISQPKLPSLSLNPGFSIMQIKDQSDHATDERRIQAGDPQVANWIVSSATHVCRIAEDRPLS
jgi:hypothetical protein